MTSGPGIDDAPGAFADQAYGVVAERYETTAGGWPEAIHSALAGLLDFLAASPALTQSCFTGPSAADGRALERREQIVGRFSEFFEAGHAQRPQLPPSVVTEAVVGGIYELIRAHAAERPIDTLTESLPTATLIALTPFVGRAEADRLAAKPAPSAARLASS